MKTVQPRRLQGLLALAASFVLIGSAALAQSFAPGTKVQASPTAMDGYWQACLVVGPGANGTHQLNCAANPYRDQSFVWVQDKWIRPAGDGPAAAPAPPTGAAANAAAPAGADPFPVGSTVLASPDQMDGQWQRCVVKTAADAYGYHKLACANQHAGAHDEVVNTVTQTAAPTKWMKPDDPTFRPDMQLAAAKPAAPALPTPKSADGLAARVAQGPYECWSSNRANLLLNFTVTGPGQYRASDGSAGTFAFDPASKAMRFTGYINEVLPAGFSALYHEPKGLPTVSFQARGGEAAFCEKL